MANFCVDAASYKSAETLRFNAIKSAAQIKQGVAVAQFALNAADAIANFRKISNVTSRGIAIEEEQFNHLKDLYWPAETQMLNEFTQKTVWDEQAVLAKRYAGRMWAPIAADFAKKLRLLECNKPRYCTNAYVKKLQEMMVQRSATRANVTLLADKIAFYEVQAIDDTDFERRKQVIAIRQGLIQQAASLMENAARGFSGAGANSFGALNNAIATFGNAWGEINNADNRVGADPYFHSQAARNVMPSNGSSMQGMPETSTNTPPSEAMFYDFASTAPPDSGMAPNAPDYGTGLDSL